MNNIKIILFGIFVFIFVSGCQHIKHDKSSEPYNGELNTDLSKKKTFLNKQTKTKTKDYKNLTGHNKQIPDNKIQTSSTKTQIDITKTKQIKNTQASSNKELSSINKNNKSNKELPQEAIDRALALCQSAQIFWEKGELEKALADLDMAYLIILEFDIDFFPELNQEKDDLRYLISKRILEIYASRNIVVNGKYEAIPIILNKYVKKQIKQLTGPEKKSLIRALERAKRYRPYILSELEKAGLPSELSWLPLIESGFKVNALSKARALGLWQFIPSTGYKFGLKRDNYIDERMDTIKSTKAAISYLSELHKIFGDWTTVLAAYNCGEGRVLKIIRTQNINYLDNVWDLYQKLPRETARYIPRFLAVLHVVKNLEKYNIKLKNKFKPIEYQEVIVKKQLKLKDIAREIGINNKILKQLNPELRYAVLPPEEYLIKIPKEKIDIFIKKLDKIKSYYIPPKYAYHRVKQKETLGIIAKKYNTDIKSIVSANNIVNNFIVVGKNLKIPIPPHKTSLFNSGTSGRFIKYTVKRGDNLWVIARKYNSTTKKIINANNLSKSRTLHIGQILSIPLNKKIVINKRKKNTSTYWVKFGDNLFQIAREHNMSLDRLFALNRLTDNTKIYPGQKLIVEQ